MTSPYLERGPFQMTEMSKKTLPAIIDTLALADEVHYGRYPGMIRCKDEKHGDHCFLCLQGRR